MHVLQHNGANSPKGGNKMHKMHSNTSLADCGPAYRLAVMQRNTAHRELRAARRLQSLGLLALCSISGVQ